MAFCTSCGATLTEDMKFCTSCGHVVETAAVPESESFAAEPVATEPVVEIQLEPEIPAAPPEPAAFAETQPEPVAPAPQAQPTPAAPVFVAAAAPAAPVYTPPQQPVPPVMQNQYAPQNQYAQPQRPVQNYQQPGYAPPPQYNPPQYQNGAERALVSAWGWVGIFLLTAIPLVGFILTIVWACGGCTKLQKRSYARGLLLMMAIGVVIAIVIGVVFAQYIWYILSEIQFYF